MECFGPLARAPACSACETRPDPPGTLLLDQGRVRLLVHGGIHLCTGGKCRTPAGTRTEVNSYVRNAMYVFDFGASQWSEWTLWNSPSRAFHSIHAYKQVDGKRELYVQGGWGHTVASLDNPALQMEVGRPGPRPLCLGCLASLLSCGCPGLCGGAGIRPSSAAFRPGASGCAFSSRDADSTPGSKPALPDGQAQPGIRNDLWLLRLDGMTNTSAWKEVVPGTSLLPPARMAGGSGLLGGSAPSLVVAGGLGCNVTSHHIDDCDAVLDDLWVYDLWGWMVGE